MLLLATNGSRTHRSGTFSVSAGSPIYWNAIRAGLRTRKGWNTSSHASRRYTNDIKWCTHSMGSL